MELLTGLKTLELTTGEDLQGPPLSLANMSMLTRLKVRCFMHAFPVDLGGNLSLQLLIISCDSGDEDAELPSSLIENILGLSGL